MARAVAPGGALVLQWSRGNARDDGGRSQAILDDVMSRPRWRDRLAGTPFTMRQCPGAEVAARVVAEGLAIELPPTGLDALFVAEPEALGRIIRSAGLAAQADKLGDDADDFVIEVATEMIAADELNPHNTRLIARRRVPRSGN
jgi:hypothetical protein